MEKKNTWETYSSKQLKELEKINAQYRDFLDNGKTERECIDTIVNTIEKSGYRELESLIKEGAALKTGDKVYSVWMNKSIAMFQIGRGGYIYDRREVIREGVSGVFACVCRCTSACQCI